MSSIAARPRALDDTLAMPQSPRPRRPPAPRALLPLLPLLLALAACRGPLPCEGCDELGEDDESDAPIPDLPCGGADLQTDDDNCGSCGNECPLWYAGSAVEAGGCQDGECGPGWTNCLSGGADSCAELCEFANLNCVPDGCGGATAQVYDVFPFLGCNPYRDPPRVTLQGPGSCDQAIPWETTIESATQVLCCCDDS